MSSHTPTADQNLLFGIIALQMDFISREAMIAGMQAWVFTKTKSLAMILEGQGVLKPDRRQLLESLVQEHLKQHNNSTEQSLASIDGAGCVCKEMEKIHDAELKAFLATLSDSGITPPEEPVEPLQPKGKSLMRIPGISPLMRFHIVRPHAKGNLGEVFLAKDEELHREVALKEIRAYHADNPDSRSRFLLEAEVTGGLEHPGVVPVYGLGKYRDGRPYYAMRFIKGESFKDAIDRFHLKSWSDPGEKYLELRHLLARFIAVCQTIEYAHSRGVLHRDLKPSNIMLGKYGETLVVDWGLAKVVGRSETIKQTNEETLAPSSGSNSTATQVGKTIGTPAFMSPEQAAAKWDSVGPASDIYSLGATLFVLLTGRPAVQGITVEQVLEKVKTGDILQARQALGETPPALDAICTKAMALKPEDRYPSAQALATDIEHWLADEPVSVRQESAVEQFGRWGRRHKALLTGAAGLLLAAVMALSLSTFLIGREKAQTEIARTDAEAAKQIAQDQARISKERLARVYAAEGMALLNADKPEEAAVWLAEALALDAGDERKEALHRQRLAAVWQQIPKQVQMCFHDGSVNFADFSPDGRSLATASSDGTARIWDLATGKPLTPPLRHKNSVQRIVFSPDGKQVLTSSFDHTAALWNARTGARVHTFRHDGNLWFSRFSPDGKRIVTTSLDHTVKLWDTASGALIGQPLDHKDDPVWGYAAFSSDGRWLVTMGGKRARIWNVETGKPLDHQFAHDDNVVCAAFSPDGKHLVTTTWDQATTVQTAIVWDVATGKQIDTLPSWRGETFTQASFTWDSRKVLTGEPRLCDIQSGKQISLPGRLSWVHQPGERHPSFSRDGEYEVVCPKHEAVARLLNHATGRLHEVHLGQSQPLDRAEFNAARKRVATATGNTVRVWSLDGQALTPPLAHPGPVTLLHFSGDGSKLITLNRENICVWDIETQKQVICLTLEGYKQEVQRAGQEQASNGAADKPARSRRPPFATVAINHDGSRLLTVRKDSRDARLWNAGTGELLKQLVHQDAIQHACFSEDGKQVLTSGKDRMVRFWDARTGKPSRNPLPHQKWVTQAALSIDGRNALTACSDQVQVWNLEKGTQLGEIMQHRKRVTWAGFSPDGMKVLTLSDRTAQLWTTATGTSSGPALDHKTPVVRAAFSPDSLRVLTVTADSSVHLWDATTGEMLAMPLTSHGNVLHEAFAVGKEGFYTLTAQQELQFLDLTLDDRPVEDLRLLAQLLSGYRLDDQGKLAACEPASMQAAWEKLRGKYPREFQAFPRDVLSWREHEAGEAERADNWPEADLQLKALLDARPDDASLHGRRGRARLHLGEYKEAVADFTKAIDLQAKQPAMWYLRAYACYRQGNLEAAERDYERAGQMAPRDGALHLSQHLVHMQQGQEDKAAADLVRAIELSHALLPPTERRWSTGQTSFPREYQDHWQELANHLTGLIDGGRNEWWLWRGRGLAWATLGKWKDAAADFSKAIDLRPEDVDSLRGRARARLELRQYQAAVGDFTRAIQLSKDDAALYYLRGIAWARLLKWQFSFDDLDRAIELKAKGWPVRAERGWAASNLKRTEQAIKDYTQAIELGGRDPGLFNLRGLLYMNSYDYDRAIADFNEVIRLDSKLAWAYSNRGDAYRSKGAFQQAVADLSEAIRLDPSARRYWVRGLVYRSMGDYTRALADQDEAIRIDPLYANALAHRALIHAAMGNHGKAVADLDEAIRLAPTWNWPIALRAMVRYEQGNHARAVSDCNEALRRVPRWTLPLQTRADAYREQGKYELAIADCTELIRIDAKNAAAFNSRALAHRRQGNTARAAADYQEAVRLEPRYAVEFNQKGQHDKVIAETTAALERQPKRIDLYQRRALACESRGLYLRAGADICRAVQLAPDQAASYRDRGETPRLMNDFAGAFAEYAEALRMNPKDVPALLGRARSYAATRVWDRAIADCMAVLALEPKSALAYRIRGDAQAGKKETGLAISDFTAGLKIDPRWGRLQAARGRLHAANRAWKAASADFTKAIENGDDSELTGFQHALTSLAIKDLAAYKKACAALLERHGTSAKSYTMNEVCWTCLLGPDAIQGSDRLVRMAEQALEGNPGSYNLLNTLGCALYRAGRYDAAIQRLNEAIRVQGKDGAPIDWIFLAMAHHKLGKKAEAGKWLAKAAAGITEAEKDAKLPWSTLLESQLLLQEATRLIKP